MRILRTMLRVGDLDKSLHLFVLITVVTTFSVFAVAEELLRTTTTWEGDEIVYPEGKAEVTSVKLRIAAGQTTPFHCHPVPTMGYVLKGTIEVETSSGKKTILKEGDSAIEVMRTLHRGRAVNGPVEIIVFYAGAESIPTTVMPADDPDFKYCDNPSEEHVK